MEIKRTVTQFNRTDGTVIEKTTLYFLAIKTDESEKYQTEDELADEVMWFKAKDAIELLRKQGNEEYLLIERVI